MDVSELEQKLHKQYTSTRKPLVPTENKNGSTHGSRYKSSAPSSPNARREPSGAKRSVSAERKRASRTSSPTPPSTPVQETDVLPASRKITGSKLPLESLWPSTMRSLSVSFQSDTISIPISKKEKSVPHRKVESSPLRKAPSPSIENAKPVDSLNSRLVDQHRWPSRTSGRIDLTDTKSKASSSSLEKSSSDLLLQILSHDVSQSSSHRAHFAKNLRSSSPSLTRRVSPVRSSRGPSPARARPSSPLRQQPHNTTVSVLSFVADIKKGQKAANHIDDVHELRLMYNRHLQWRYTNARAHTTLESQKRKAEKTLYRVWNETVDLRESVREKRAALQHLRIKSKLCSVLNDQLNCLDDWASIEMDHADSLDLAIKDLRASTVRVPITGGAKGGIESVKNAMSSVVDVMQSIGSSMCSLLTKVEAMNKLVSEVAAVSVHERAMLDECESLLRSTTAMQVTEDSLRIHALQSLEKW